MSIKKVLIANRGEIAVRVIRACRSLGIETIAAVSTADKNSLAAQLADQVVCIGPPKTSESYLNQSALLATAKGTSADAIHPGYGFLSENSSFAKACEDNGVIFIGPRSESIAQMGNKLAAREIAKQNGVPIVPGSPRISSFRDALKVANEIGFPLLLKAAAGGGGRGIRVVHDKTMLQEAFANASAEAESAFGDRTLYIERYIASGRHIEIQVFGDKVNNAIHLGERDCSMQRRYQKIIEEAPSAMVPNRTRDSMRAAAVALVKGIKYQNAGTVEFIYDQSRDEFYFLEMNTRIQVEHPVTEMITGLDLVQLQIEVASEKPLPFKQSDIKLSGHAIECRVNAESPSNSFMPSPGTIFKWETPAESWLRIDTHCYESYKVPPFYDSLLAKLIIKGDDRHKAIERTIQALREFHIEGIDTNLNFLLSLTSSDAFKSGEYSTRWVEDNIDNLI